MLKFILESFNVRFILRFFIFIKLLHNPKPCLLYMPHCTILKQ